jgi:hypothetical protein
MHTAVNKRNLDVQTRMSQTIHLDPVEPEQRTIFVDIRNTSDKAEFDVQNDVVATLQQRGYRVTDNPALAHYWLQVNVRSVLNLHPAEALAEGEIAMSPIDIEALLNPQSAVLDGGLESDSSDYVDHHPVHVHAYGGGHIDSDDLKKVVAAAIVIVAAESLGNALVHDVYYTVVTDIQIAEKVFDTTVHEAAHHELTQGDSGSTESIWTRDVDRRKYQTRIVSFANQVNLDWHDAQAKLREGLTRSLSGIF